MNETIIKEVERNRDQTLDVERLIKAVRGSQAARVLYEFRSTLSPSGAPKGPNNRAIGGPVMKSDAPESSFTPAEMK